MKKLKECSNCGERIPIEEEHACENCGKPLCGQCICEECENEKEEQRREKKQSVEEILDLAEKDSEIFLVVYEKEMVAETMKEAQRQILHEVQQRIINEGKGERICVRKSDVDSELNQYDNIVNAESIISLINKIRKEYRL